MNKENTLPKKDTRKVKQILSGEDYILMKTNALGERPQTKFMHEVYEAMVGTAGEMDIIIYKNGQRKISVR